MMRKRFMGKAETSAAAIFFISLFLPGRNSIADRSCLSRGRTVKRFAFFLLGLLLGAPAFATITQVGTPVTPNNANNTNTTAPLGGTTQANDLAVTFTGCNAASSCTLTTPASGYTNADSRTGGSQKAYLDYKVAGASESDPTVTRATGSAADQFFGAGLILRGVDTSTPIHATATAAPAQSSGTLATPALTITADNSYVCMYLVLASGGTNVTAFGNFNPNGTGNWTALPTLFYNTSVRVAIGGWCTTQTTATNISTSTISVTGGTNGNVGRFIIVAFKAAATAPTFSVSPAIGTRTTSTIPVTATTACTDCNYYGVAVTDGSGAPTCTQIKAGQNSGGTSAYKAFGPVAMTATVQNTGTFSTYTDGTVRDGYFCLNSTAGGDSTVAPIADMYKIPAFTTPLTVASQTTTAYTSNSKVLDGPGTVDWVACPKDASPPTVSQVEARTGGCIVNGATDDATGTMTLTITGTVFPIYDLYYVGSYGSQHEPAVNALNDELLDAAAGKEYINGAAGLASISATSPCKFVNDHETPDLVAGDIVTVSSATSPNAFTITWGTDCDFSYSGTTARQSFTLDGYDVSAGGNFSWNTETFYVNNQAPVFSPPNINSLWRIGDVISLNYCDLATDAEGDTLTGSNSSTGTGTGANKRPAGTSFGGTNNCVLSGTLTTAATGSFDFTVTDIATDTATLTDTWEVRAAQETVPDCASTNLTLSECAGLIESNYLQWDIDSTQCSTDIAPFSVISQSPAAGTLQDPDTVIELVIAKRCGRGPFGWPNFRFKFGE